MCGRRAECVILAGVSRSRAPVSFGDFAMGAVGELITPAAVDDRVQAAIRTVTGNFAGGRIVGLSTGRVTLTEQTTDELAFLVPVHATFRAGPLPVKVGAAVDFDLTLRVRAHAPAVLRAVADPVADLQLQVSGSGWLPMVSGGGSRRAAAASLDGVIGALLGRQRVDLLQELTGVRSGEGQRIAFAALGPELLEACADPEVISRLLGPEADTPDLELLSVERVGPAPRTSDSELNLRAIARVTLRFPVQEARFEVVAYVQTTATVTTSTDPATVRVRFGTHRVRLEGPPRRTAGPRRPVPTWWLGRIVRRKLLSRLPELLTERELRVGDVASRPSDPALPEQLDRRIVISEQCRASGERLHAMTLGEGQSVTVRARLERSTGALGSPLAEVAICDGVGDCTVVERTGFDGSDRATIDFDFTAPHAGRWAVRIRDVDDCDAGAAFSYRLQVKPT